MNSLDGPLERAFQLADTMLRLARKRAYIVVMQVDAKDSIRQVSGWAGGMLPPRSIAPQKAMANAGELISLTSGELVFGPIRPQANRTTRGAVRYDSTIVSVAGLGEASQLMALVVLRATIPPAIALHSVAQLHHIPDGFVEGMSFDESIYGTEAFTADPNGEHAFVPVTDAMGKVSHYIAHHLDETLRHPSLHWDLVVPNSLQFIEWLNQLPNHVRSDYMPDGSNLSIITWQNDENGVPIGVSLRNKWWDPRKTMGRH